jgi:hypothetical protein
VEFWHTNIYLAILSQTLFDFALEQVYNRKQGVFYVTTQNFQWRSKDQTGANYQRGHAGHA